MHRSKRASGKIVARILATTAIGFALGVAFPATAMAQAVSNQQAFDIDGGDLGSGLNKFASVTGYQLLYPSSLVQGKTTQGVHGSLSVEAALAQLLGGSGLTFRVLQGRTIQIEALPEGDSGERVLGAVRVQGSQDSGGSLAGSTPVNGINGSRDVTATEGTGSYTSNALTVGSKTPASIKDTPMTVSVLTDQRLKDQNITDLDTAMRNLPGVTVVHNGTVGSELQFYSRGFQITQFQFDGGAAMDGSANGYYRPIIDLSLYDHIELVRGATGTFNAFGSPGGVVNLVRKKPLDHQQFTFDLQLGSWDWHRASVDVTGPLGFDGKLRGRFIATHQDNNYFYDTAKANTNVLSASLEYDLGPATLLSVGANYQDVHDVPWAAGLPRYLDGRSLGLPRSTCLCFGFDRDDAENKEFFGQIDQRIGSNWNFKFKATRINQSRINYVSSIAGAVNPYSLQGASAQPGSLSEARVRQSMFEATLDGRFRLFGQYQKILLGANYSMANPSGAVAYSNYDIYTMTVFPFQGVNDNSVNVFDFNSDEWGRPAASSVIGTIRPFADSRVLNSYASFELSPLKWMHIDFSLRYSQYRNRSLILQACNARTIRFPFYKCFGHSIGEYLPFSAGNKLQGSNFSWPPTVQLRFDINNNLSASAIYTDIYVNQSNYLNKDGSPMPPITGGNLEGELKWQSPNQKFNATISSYYTKQHGDAFFDCGYDGGPACTTTNSTSDPNQLNQQTQCCYKTNPAYAKISYGLDFELSGEIRRNWQISFSYNYNKNFIKGDDVLFNGQRKPLDSFEPRHKYQIWTTYTVGKTSKLAGAVVGFGIRGQSKTFVSDGYCKSFVLNQDTGEQDCGEFQSVLFTDPGHIVFSGSLGFKLNSKMGIDVQVENILNSTYYETVGRLGSGNWYGSPRSVKVTLRSKL
ncbi:TonB-dependent receptor [Sphingomonas sp.]|uniref:TonB-dependent siderophore receptor n=1 Tax=Sphingomonas sp. TaxID=28214 RepID=UPI0025D3EDA3|nr:TonB-dependent receptor [Sphingomonas sp.]